jgi:subtilisin family serine protease
VSVYRRLPLALLALLVLCVAPSAAAATARSDSSPDGPAYAAGRALVQFKPGVSAAAIARASSRAGARPLREIDTPFRRQGELVVVRSGTASTKALVRALNADPRVEYAEPDYIRRIDSMPDDPRLGELWGMPQIRALGAWDLTAGAADVVVADIDTGADYTHPDLAASMWKNPGEIPANDIDDDGNGYVDDVYGIDSWNRDSDPVDDHGHGSHTAGTIAAVGDNGVGVTGVAWRAKVMALKSFNENCRGRDSGSIVCINYAIARKLAGVNVVAINASWGGGAYSQALKDAIDAAGAAGIVFVAAAGNDNVDTDSEPHYPSCYDSDTIVSVAATDRFDVLAPFSSYGAESVDLAAPGVGILSTVPGLVDESGYVAWDGTSMATPHVAGAIALCASLFPAESAAARIDRVLDSVDPVPALSGACVTGGRLDVLAALGGPAPSDAEIPGVPAHTFPVTGTLGAGGDAHDVCRVFLRAGWTVTAAVTGDPGLAADVYLFAPGAATVADPGAAVAGAAGAGSFSYRAPATGTYFVDVSAASGSGSYTLSVECDDDIPGVPIPASPFMGSLSPATDKDDVFALRLDAGDVLYASVTASDGSDIGLNLYFRGALSISVVDWIFRSATEGVYPRWTRSYIWAPGTYYLDVAAAGAGGDYTVAWAVQSEYDDIPGVPIPGSPFAGTLDGATDTDDVFAVDLHHGDVIEASISGPADTDFRLWLYEPGSASVWTSYAEIRAEEGPYPRTLRSVAWSDGTYYLDAAAAHGAGEYTVEYSVTPAPQGADIPGVPLTGSPVTGELAARYDCRVYSFYAREGDEISFSLSGPDQTSFFLALFEPGAGSVVDDWPVQWGFGDPYPAPVVYTAATTGTHYILVRSGRGGGEFALTHTIDLEAPRTVAVGAGTMWHPGPVTVRLQANDGVSGVESTAYSLDGGPWVPRSELVVGGDGRHRLDYRSVDRWGNEEPVRTTWVNVDATLPLVSAERDVSVRRGRTAELRFRAEDLTPKAWFVIRILKRGRTVATLEPGTLPTRRDLTYSYRCRLRRGQYVWEVLATDQAGNVQSRTGRALLTVR